MDEGAPAYHAMDTPAAYLGSSDNHAEETLESMRAEAMQLEAWEVFCRACDSVTFAEMQTLAGTIHEQAGESAVPDDATLQRVVATLHWKNPVCLVCHNRDPSTLCPCTGCGLEFYCDEECQNQHWRDGHRRLCGRRDAPFDHQHSPYRPAAVGSGASLC